jgi:aminoglycoside phosphotransferase (APT) family kinase protein
MIEITTEIVRSLIREQFTQWQELPVQPVAKSGHDNRTFHLGDEMTVRLPSGEGYVAQVEKEMTWLPKLKPYISLPISSPIAKGRPAAQYPFPWSVNRYIQGETASSDPDLNLKQFAADLTAFLVELQAIDTTGAPAAGPHNFFRGGDLSVYHDETVAALSQLKGELPTDLLRRIWQRAIRSKWPGQAVWIHGDVAPGNLLVKDGRLCGVIDFGTMGVGDPACDYAIAWTFLDMESRKVFLQGIDPDTRDRAKGWALWKALITFHSTNMEVARNAAFTIQSILDDEAQGK